MSSDGEQGEKGSPTGGDDSTFDATVTIRPELDQEQLEAVKEEIERAADAAHPLRSDADPDGYRLRDQRLIEERRWETAGRYLFDEDIEIGTANMGVQRGPLQAAVDLMENSPENYRPAILPLDGSDHDDCTEDVHQTLAFVGIDNPDDVIVISPWFPEEHRAEDGDVEENLEGP